MSLLELFCAVDDFWMSFVPMWHHTQVENGRQRPRAGYMYRSRDYDDPHPFSPVPFSDFQSLLYRVCPGSSQKRVSAWSRAISALWDSSRRCLSRCWPICPGSHGACTGISFIDSTSLVVCHPKRISQHRVFAGQATRGKTRVRWFFGFKLHLAVNEEARAAGLLPDSRKCG
jgi:Transposase DDE domain